MTRPRIHVKKGDMVEAISGADRGKSGKVLQVLALRDRAIVEGLAIMKKHLKPTQDNPEGGIIEKEGTLHVSNLKVVERGARTGKEAE